MRAGKSEQEYSMSPFHHRFIFAFVCSIIVSADTVGHVWRADAAEETVREHLVKAVAGSRELLGKAMPMPDEMRTQLCLKAELEDDQPALDENRFPRLADVQ